MHRCPAGMSKVTLLVWFSGFSGYKVRSLLLNVEGLGTQTSSCCSCWSSGCGWWLLVLGWLLQPDLPEQGQVHGIPCPTLGLIQSLLLSWARQLLGLQEIHRNVVKLPAETSVFISPFSEDQTLWQENQAMVPCERCAAGSTVLYWMRRDPGTHPCPSQTSNELLISCLVQ